MKLILQNGSIIECTVDEYEELYTRGLIDEKVAESIKKQSKKLTINGSAECVPVYGCISPINDPDKNKGITLF